MKAMYTAKAKVSGGRQGKADVEGAQTFDLAMPKEMGGTGEGMNPEQLFAAGYAACFQSAMMHVAMSKDMKADDSTVESHVSIGQDDAGPGFKLAVQMAVTLPSLDQAAAQELVDTAHAVCPYSNATRGNIDVDFKVKGK